MNCEYCSKEISLLDEMSRPEFGESDEISTSVRLLVPEHAEEKVYEYPCITIDSLAGRIAFLTPTLKIRIYYCPMCGRKLQ